MKQLIKCCGGCLLALLWATALLAQPGISRVEYYIDSDPGYDNGNLISLNANDTNLSNLTINIDPSSLTSGVHLLGIRARDANGAWSQDNKWLFGKPYPADTTAATAAPALKQVEYYIDNDPGYGKGIPVAIGDTNDLADINLAINISGLTIGDHNLFIRSKDARNGWSLDNVYAFTTDAAVASPSIVINSIAYPSLCKPDSANVAYHARGSYRSDNIFNAELSDSAGNFNLPTIIGSFSGTGNAIIKCAIPSGLPAGNQYKIRVKSTNPVVTGLPSDFIAGNNLTVPLITPADTIVIKQGDSIKLSAGSGYANYLWNTSDVTASIQVKEYGSYTVTVTDSNGCSATSAAVLVKVTPAITASGAVLNLCPGAFVTLTSSSAKSYLWNTADTTQSIKAASAGLYYVMVDQRTKGDTSIPVGVSYKGCGNPGSLGSADISVTGATIKWGNVGCAQRYQLRYRANGSTAWSNVITTNAANYGLNGLAASTTYQWQVRTICRDSLPIVSKYSAIDSFTTNGAITAGNALAAREKISTAYAPAGFKAMLYPNPANQNASLKVVGNAGNFTVLLTDITGKILWQKNKITGSVVSLPVDGFSGGTYLVIIKDDHHKRTLKLVKK